MTLASHPAERKIAPVMVKVWPRVRLYRLAISVSPTRPPLGATSRKNKPAARVTHPRTIDHVPGVGPLRVPLFNDVVAGLIPRSPLFNDVVAGLILRVEPLHVSDREFSGWNLLTALLAANLQHLPSFRALHLPRSHESMETLAG